MIQDHGSVPKVAGITADQHSLSHHGQDEAKIAQLKIVETELVSAFADLMDKLGTEHNGVSLLDSTRVLYGSNLGNANSHEAKKLPIMVAGGEFEHGKHVAHEGETDAPLCNLYVTLLQSMGLEIDAFGQSTGALSWS